MSVPELIPCSFCGGKVSMFIGIRGGYLIKCDSFCIEQPLQQDRETSVLRWNKRADIKIKESA